MNKQSTDLRNTATHHSAFERNLNEKGNGLLMFLHILSKNSVPKQGRISTAQFPAGLRHLVHKSDP